MDYSKLPTYHGAGNDPQPWRGSEAPRDLGEATILMTLLFFGAGFGSLFALWLLAGYFEAYLRNLPEFVARLLGAIHAI